MADGNNIRCFNDDCNCDAPKAGAQEMSTAFRKRRGRKAVTGSASVAKAKEEAVKTAIEQPGDSGSEP